MITTCREEKSWKNHDELSSSLSESLISESNSHHPLPISPHSREIFQYTLIRYHSQGYNHSSTSLAFQV